MARIAWIAGIALLTGCGSNIVIPSDDAGASPSGPTLGAACDKPGALACNGEAQRLQLLCDGSHWVQNGVCSGSALCDPRPGPSAGSCQEPIAKCLSEKTFCDGSIRKTCAPNLFETSDVKCGSVALCESSKTTGCAACADGAVLCEGNTLHRCQAGKFVIEKTCTAGDSCDARSGACRPAICVADVWRCNGATLQRCNTAGTEWDTVALCGGDCNAAEHRCDACPFMGKDCVGDVPRSCGPLGSWISRPVCAAGTCKDGECLGPDACTPGEYRCSIDTLERCLDDGTGYVGTATCAPGTCDASTKSCGGSCPTAGLLDCVGDTPRYCDEFYHSTLLSPCTGSTPICFAGKCVAASAGTVIFPGKTSKAYDGVSTSGPLDPSSRFWHKGSFVEESFPRTSVMTKLDVSFKIFDDTPTAFPSCVGVTASFDVSINGVKVGSFSYVTGASPSVPFTKSFTFPGIAPAFGVVTLHYESTTELASGCGSYGWAVGGSATLLP